MPRIKLTKSAIDALPVPSSDVVYWDGAYPGFGVKITPKGRKVFIVLYRTGGAGSCLRKYTIGPTQRPVAAPFLQRGHTGSRACRLGRYPRFHTLLHVALACQLLQTLLL